MQLSDEESFLTTDSGSARRGRRAGALRRGEQVGSIWRWLRPSSAWRLTAPPPILEGVRPGVPGAVAKLRENAHEALGHSWEREGRGADTAGRIHPAVVAPVWAGGTSPRFIWPDAGEQRSRPGPALVAHRVVIRPAVTHAGTERA